VDAGVPLITDLQLAQAIIGALRHRKVKDLAILSWDEYAARRPMALR
jgi:carbamoyl-phosphate synthase large subunit